MAAAPTTTGTSTSGDDELARSDGQEQTSTSFDKHLDAFLSHLHERRSSEHTRQSYARALRFFAAWFEGANGKLPEMTEVSRADMAEYHQHLRTHKTKRGTAASPATIDLRMAALRAFYSYMTEVDESVKNPTKHIRGEKKTDDVAPKSLSKKQLRWLLLAASERITLTDTKKRLVDLDPVASERPIPKSSIEARRDFAIVVTLAYAGLRVSELCALDVSDVLLSPRSGDVVVRRGKGGKTRTVELSPETRKALSTWLTWRKRYGLPDACTSLFAGRRGGPMTPNSVERVVKKLAELARPKGLDALVTPHVLRHTYARRLIDADTPLVDVKALMGHSSVVTTSRYTKPTKEQRQAHVDKLDIVL